MIIGLGFQARSGKDTVADYLVEQHGFRKLAFADALKDGVATIFGLTREQLYGSEKEEVDPFWNDTPRNILQLVGTECMRRGYRDDIWVKCVERVIQMEPDTDWVISDVRFPNEAAAIKEWGGMVVRIDRPMNEDFGKVATKFHASEVSMLEYDEWDHIIENSLGLVELKAEAAAMLKMFKALSVSPPARTVDTTSSTTSEPKSTVDGATSP